MKSKSQRGVFWIFSLWKTLQIWVFRRCWEAIGGVYKLKLLFDFFSFLVMKSCNHLDTICKFQNASIKKFSIFRKCAIYSQNCRFFQVERVCKDSIFIVFVLIWMIITLMRKVELSNKPSVKSLQGNKSTTLFYCLLSFCSQLL